MPQGADTILEALPWPAIVLSADGRIARANPGALAVFGAWIVGRAHVSVLRRPELQRAIVSAIQTGEAGTGHHIQMDRGSERAFRVHLRPLSGDWGDNPDVVVLIFEDTTDAVHVASMRRDFVANVSHELRSPLTAIIGFIETLQGPAQNDAQGRARFLELMAREAARMNRLIADLLSLSRVEAQEGTRPKARVDLCHVIGLALDPLRAQIPTEAKLALDLPPKADILGDADQIQQVVSNLVENALKYGGNPADVTVGLAPLAYDAQIKGAAWTLTVRDRGEGIETHHIPRLTERFYRVDAHRSRAQGGTGLGLAIVKHIVNRHRGRLKIDSQKGQGTTVTVILPQA